MNKKIADYLVKTVQDATKEEREQVKKSIEQLKEKEKRILNDPNVKRQVDKMEKYNEALTKQMSQIQLAYQKAIQHLRRTCQNEYEFRTQLQELDQKMEDALLDEDEKMIQSLKSQLSRAFGNNGDLNESRGNVRLIMM